MPIDARRRRARDRSGGANRPGPRERAVAAIEHDAALVARRRRSLRELHRTPPRDRRRTRERVATRPRRRAAASSIALREHVEAARRRVAAPDRPSAGPRARDCAAPAPASTAAAARASEQPSPTNAARRRTRNASRAPRRWRRASGTRYSTLGAWSHWLAASSAAPAATAHQVHRAGASAAPTATGRGADGLEPTDQPK